MAGEVGVEATALAEGTKRGKVGKEKVVLHWNAHGVQIVEKLHMGKQSSDEGLFIS